MQSGGGHEHGVTVWLTLSYCNNALLMCGTRTPARRTACLITAERRNCSVVSSCPTPRTHLDEGGLARPGLAVDGALVAVLLQDLLKWRGVVVGAVDGGRQGMRYKALRKTACMPACHAHNVCAHGGIPARHSDSVPPTGTHVEHNVGHGGLGGLDNGQAVVPRGVLGLGVDTDGTGGGLQTAHTEEAQRGKE